MCVSEDQKTALIGWYRILNVVNDRYTRLRLEGLNPDYLYAIPEPEFVIMEMN